MKNFNRQIVIRQASHYDFEKIWKIFKETIQSMDTYAFNPETPQEEAYKIWMSPENKTYVATIEQEIVGTYYIKPNQPGLGSHVANAAFMVDPNKQGMGIGKTMAQHSLIEAKNNGFTAMQFNFVISSNLKAIELWKKMGFNIIGVSPKAFNHPYLGLIDAFIMHRYLNDN